MTLLKVVGINQVMEKMAKRRASLIDRKKVNGWAIIAIDQWIQKNFEGEGKLAVGGWQPLAPATIARRRGAGSVKILQDTGALKGRWKHFYDKNEKDRVRRLRFYNCALELIEKSANNPVSREN